MTNQTALMFSPRTIAIIVHPIAPSTAIAAKMAFFAGVMGLWSMMPTGGRSGSVRRYSTLAEGLPPGSWVTVMTPPHCVTRVMM